MKIRNFMLPVVASAMLSLVWFGQAMAGTLQDVKARGRLIAGVRTDLPPFGFRDKDGSIKGIDTDIAKALAKALFGKQEAVEFVAVDKTNGTSFLNEKRVDVLLGGMIVGHRDIIDYSLPYFESGHLILARNDSKISRYQDLAGKKVGTIQGSTGDDAVRALVPQATRTVFMRHSDALQALKERRVDAFVDTNRMVIHLQRRNPKLRLAGYQPFGSVSYGMGVRKGDEEWLGFINATLAKMKETAEYEKLQEKWFAESMALLLGFEKPVASHE